MGEPTKSEKWIAAMTAAGHTPYMADGELKFFAYEQGWCNGPGCVTCCQSWCWHCTKVDAGPLEPCRTPREAP